MPTSCLLRGFNAWPLLGRPALLSPSPALPTVRFAGQYLPPSNQKPAFDILFACARRDFSDADLTCYDFRGFDMSGVNLSGSKLPESILGASINRGTPAFYTLSNPPTLATGLTLAQLAKRGIVPARNAVHAKEVYKKGGALFLPATPEDNFFTALARIPSLCWTDSEKAALRALDTPPKSSQSWLSGLLGR